MSGSAPKPTSSSGVLNSTLGALQIGLVVSTLLYGIALAQGFYFFDRCHRKQERRSNKLIVGVLLALDTAHTSLAAHATYSYTVVNYNNASYISQFEWSLSVQIIVTAITALVSHSFFAYKIYIRESHFMLSPSFTEVLRLVSGKKLAAMTIVVLLNLLHLSITIAFNYKTLQNPDIVHEPKYTPIMIVEMVCGTLCDLNVSVLLCYFLHKSRTGLRRTESIINKITYWTAATGLITSCSTIASFICFMAIPDSLVYIGLYFVMSKLQTNSVLASLNLRDRLRRVDEADDPTVPVLPTIISDLRFSHGMPENTNVEKNTAEPRTEMPSGTDVASQMSH